MALLILDSYQKSVSTGLTVAHINMIWRWAGAMLLTRIWDEVRDKNCAYIGISGLNKTR